MLTPLALLVLASLAPQWGARIGGGIGGGFQNRLLVIDLDDVGFDLLEESATPMLDFLEANGRFYTSFMTAPICSPTRAMFNTGAYPSHPDVLVGEGRAPSMRAA